MSPKLTSYIENISSKAEKEIDTQLANLVLSTIYILLENCSESISEHMRKIALVLINFQVKNSSMRFRVGRCLLSIVRIRKDLLVNFRNVLFTFYSDSLSIENYELNLIAAEFFLFVLDDEKVELMKHKDIYQEYRIRVKGYF